MNKSTILSIIRSKFNDFKRSGDEIQIKCPYCPKMGQGVDRKYKLYINIQKQVFNCFRCGTKGKLNMLIPQVDIVQDKAIDIVEKKTLESLPHCIKLHDLEYPWSELVFELLLDKGFSPATLDKVLYFCKDYRKGDFKYGPSLIFPIYQLGQYRGFQARTIYKNVQPKYISATGLDRETILYNYDSAFNQKTLVITEGFFDCLKVGANAIATLGKEITEKQLRLIKLGDFKEVIVFLDRDAEKESRDIAKKIAIYFKTYLAIPTKKDPGQMSRIEIKELLNNKNKLERIY
jgi:5S rRNA maturation endonuclease (ribonuclease M5)